MDVTRGGQTGAFIQALISRLPNNAYLMLKFDLMAENIKTRVTKYGSVSIAYIG